MIDSFSGEYDFLSNFYPVAQGIKYCGLTFPSVENAYQAAKVDPMYFETDVTSLPPEILELTMCTPQRAKQIGKSLKLRENWDNIKVSIMAKLLEEKFSYPDFEKKLLFTWGEKLVEGNWWNDTFWGVCKGKGENNLGKLLMALRLVKKVGE